MPATDDPLDAILDAIRDRLREGAGLQVPDRDVGELRSVVRERVRATGAGDVSHYVERLRDEPMDGGGEWQRIVSAWTNNESFLFRDDGQIALLRNRLIPDLVEKRSRRGRLKVWSAGCSTGEEVYTLAILLREKTPSTWDVEVVGTDIDDEALEQAREAVYTGNAFRRTSKETRDRYFEPHRGGYRPVEEVRATTTFLHHNLVGDEIPPEVEPADLVVCRNVFIYFDREAIQTAVERFAEALSPGGYLMTGHTEAMGVDLEGFASRSLPGSVVHERVPEARREAPGPGPADEVPSDPLRAAPPAPDLGSPDRTPPRPEPGSLREETRVPAGTPADEEPTPAERARSHLVDGDPLGALEALEEAGLDRASPEELLLAARAQADLGDLDQARTLAEQVLDKEPFTPDGHLLLARVHLEEGDREAARSHLERVLYLDDSRLVAYVELAWVYEDEGLPDRAERMRRTALDLASGMDPDQPAPGYPDTTAGELADHLRSTLGLDRPEEVPT